MGRECGGITTVTTHFSSLQIIMPLQNVDGDNSPRTPDSYLTEISACVLNIANRIFVCFSILSKYNGDSGGIFLEKDPCKLLEYECYPEEVINYT